MKISVIVCAAGKGERARLGRNKLLAPFMGANALYHTMQLIGRLSSALKEQNGGDELAETVVASSEEDFDEINAVCAPFGGKVVRGGATRTESVYRALREATGEIVLVHDGARPFASVGQFLACIECVKTCRSAVVALPAVDTTAICRDGYVQDIPPRNEVYRIQTPQGFFTEDLRRAYELAMKDGGAFTDDGSVYSRYIAPAKICPCGTEANRKLTYREDFEVGGKVADKLVVTGERVGFGADVHAFGRAQNYVTLCGVKVPCDEGLVAHSDGDAAIHAVMDALLSAAGLKDIGHYFPDGDERYRGADSARLLEEVVSLVRKSGYQPSGLSVAIQAEKPRLSAYIDRMVARLAQLTGVEQSAVSVAAGTCEKLGFVGEGRGICAYCAAVLTRADEENSEVNDG